MGHGRQLLQRTDQHTALNYPLTTAAEPAWQVSPASQALTFSPLAPSLKLLFAHIILSATTLQPSTAGAPKPRGFKIVWISLPHPPRYPERSSKACSASRRPLEITCTLDPPGTGLFDEESVLS